MCTCLRDAVSCIARITYIVCLKRMLLHTHYFNLNHFIRVSHHFDCWFQIAIRCVPISLDLWVNARINWTPPLIIDPAAKKKISIAKCEIQTFVIVDAGVGIVADAIFQAQHSGAPLSENRWLIVDGPFIRSNANGVGASNNVDPCMLVSHFRGGPVCAWFFSLSPHHDTNDAIRAQLVKSFCDCATLH